MANEIVRAASLSPAEGDLQVFVLVDFHLVGRAAPTLLKTIEEPASTAVFVVLAEEVTPDLVTIASRCVQVDLAAVPANLLVERLVAEGVESEVARVAAEGAGGSLSRARLQSAIGPRAASSHAAPIAAISPARAANSRASALASSACTVARSATVRPEPGGQSRERPG